MGFGSGSRALARAADGLAFGAGGAAFATTRGAALTTACGAVFATACGAVLARAHARTGDAVAIHAYIGRGSAFDKAMASYALAYARQNHRDHADLVEAISRRQLPAGRAW